MTEVSIVASPLRRADALWALARSLGPLQLPSSGFNDPVARGRLPWFKRALSRADLTELQVDKLIDFARLESAAEGRWPHGPVRTHRLLVNVMGPMAQLPPHVDPPTFTGVSAWAGAAAQESGFTGARALLGVMSRSGLFERWRAHTISGVLWSDFEGGGDYLIWAAGRHQPPVRIPSSSRYAVLADNERLQHGFTDIGTVEQQRSTPRLDASSTLSFRDEQWEITGPHETFAGVEDKTFRVSAVWQARAIAPPPSGELTLGEVVETFTADLRRRGSTVTPGPDPLTDRRWFRTLLREYGF